MKKLLEMFPGLHGVYVANGDLPSTRVSAVSDIAALKRTGVVFDFVTSFYMKETIAQGLDPDDFIWSGGVACYTQGLTLTTDGAETWPR